MSLGHECEAFVMGLMSFYQKEETGDLFTLLRVQLESAHLQARKRVPTKSQPSWHPHMDFPAWRTMRNKCYLSHTFYVILLQ